MELSAVVNKYDVPLTRTERSLVGQIPDGTSTVSDDRYDQQMKVLVAAREALKQLPDRKTMERQSKMDKAGMLKDRLKMLRQMIQFMSPGAVKSLIVEMKQISAQITSLTGENGGLQGGGNVGVMTESASGAETPPEMAQAASVDNLGSGDPHEQPVLSGTVQADSIKSGSRNPEDRQLKETVEELKSLYKLVLAALKRKQQQSGGHTSQQELRRYVDVPDNGGIVALKV